MGKMQPLLSITDLDQMVVAFTRNMNDETMEQFRSFMASQELRFLPLKTMAYALKVGDVTWALRCYLNQQDKVDRTSGGFHGWMRQMCGL